MGGSFSRPDVTGPEKRRTSTSDDEKATATLPATSTSASASTSTDTEIRGQKIGLSLKGQQHASARTSKYFFLGGAAKFWSNCPVPLVFLIERLIHNWDSNRGWYIVASNLIRQKLWLQSTSVLLHSLTSIPFYVVCDSSDR